MLFIKLLVRFFEGMCGQEGALLVARFYRFHSSTSVALNAISDLIHSSIN
jgi:hypothetical protein